MCIAGYICLLFTGGQALAGGDPGPGGEINPGDLPGTQGDVHALVLDLSWSFVFPMGPDWRSELVGDDPSHPFQVRWRYTGPGFDSAVLAVYDANNQIAGEIPLPLNVPPVDGYRYANLQIGSLPVSPTLTMQVRVKDFIGKQLGSASNEAQITAPAADPFLATDLYLNGLLNTWNVPGMAGGVSCNVTNPTGGPPLLDTRVFAGGRRRFNGGNTSGNIITPSDKWHLGSDTKAMTCTLIARLIQAGTPLPGSANLLAWDTNLSDIFPEWSTAMHPRFNSTTLRDLACHRSGLRYTAAENAATRVEGGANDDPRTFRRAMTMTWLTRQHFVLKRNAENRKTIEPTSVPTTWGMGSPFCYGYGNYLVLGAVIEQLLDMSYEGAMINQLFAPLGMSSARFGMPALPVAQNYLQPHGHLVGANFPNTISIDNRAMPPVWNPAGGVYMTMQDWMKFLRLHLNGTEGGLTLSPATLAELHTAFPMAPGGNVRYGFGWVIGFDAGGIVLDHDGTYFRFYASCRVHQGHGYVACAAVNVGVGNIAPENSAWNATRQFRDHLEEKAQAKQDIAAVPGTYPAGSRDSLGIGHIEIPVDGPQLMIDNPLGPVTLSSEPATYLPVSLYLHHEYQRLAATHARLPRALSSVRDVDGRFCLRVSTDPGAIYQLWRVPISGFHSLPSLGHLEAEITAEALETEFFFQPAVGVLQEFFFIADFQ
jgi:D-alanyl-D-alanine carboxypeptidase